METGNQPFRIRTFRLNELAMLYFASDSKEYASKLFRKSLRSNPLILLELEQAGLRKHARILSPKQVGIIVHYLGEP